MIKVRKSQERGHTRESWLDSYHTFSFDTYQDPEHTQFRTLRVINEDWVAPARGFPLHPHRDMEIFTFVISGVLEHKDSLGGHERIAAGEVQRITAGSGIRHSEANPSSSEEVHLLQIWIFPEEKGLEPGYEKKSFAAGDNDEALRLIASPDGRGDSAVIHQNVALYTGSLQAGGQLDYSLGEGRHAWLQIITGDVAVNGCHLSDGDGAAVSDEGLLDIQASSDTRFILFDLN
ncbi:MAG: pirin family protein [Desulfuromonadales bacterium]|nr:pirin family protein [Desulfuromonadales bacterium]NIR33700.1 pirin family protein [Desulfuromonadales bacterium]NIS44022.1 pirin family protein [Desulfuromonadales bacterium]